ncbi:hypothetical protein T492DRAFT_1004091 [Pavlovales sp. CCMP2436]|nr:hypothetical protein T492DRAFT_1004091 [Pavlovales sp. CCMP2436]
MAAVNDKRTLYVGGLEDTVTAESLRAVFVPFGEVLEIGLPIDQTSQKHKGFAFVQFETADDAQDAVDNMDGSELFGRVLKVNVSKPQALKGAGHRPVWEADADTFYQHGDKQEVEEEVVEKWRTGRDEAAA